MLDYIAYRTLSNIERSSMKQLIVLFSFVLAQIFCLGSASAQGVGFCNMNPTMQTFDVDANLWMRARDTGQQFQAMRDPSGMTFILIPSAIPNNRLWVTWDLRVIAINVFNGVWTPIGQCAFHPAFAATVSRPQYHNPNLEYDEIEVASTNGGASPTTRDFKIPTGQIPEDKEFLEPMNVTLATATDCMARAGNDQVRFLDCVANQHMGSKEKAIYNCMREAGANKEALAMCALGPNLGSNERAALGVAQSCARQYGTDWNKYPVCMAGSLGSDDTRRAVACAQQNMGSGQPNYWGMAACYAGPSIMGSLNPNAETMVALECAMSSGGQPYAFVGCTSGRLMANELQKCFSHGVGGNGCFGNGNSINKAYDAIDNEMRKLGSHTVAYQAWQAYAATTNPVYAAKAINNVVREGGVAAQNVAREAAKVMPRIKVKRIKIKW